MVELIAATCGGFLAGWICRGLQLERLGRNSNGNCEPMPPAPDWRRSFSHENFNRPDGPPPLKFRRSEPIRFDEGHTQRGNGHGGPTTPKPPISIWQLPPGGRIIDASGMTIGYRPLPQPGAPSPPPEAP